MDRELEILLDTIVLEVQRERKPARVFRLNEYNEISAYLKRVSIDGDDELLDPGYWKDLYNSVVENQKCGPVRFGARAVLTSRTRRQKKKGMPKRRLYKNVQCIGRCEGSGRCSPRKNGKAVTCACV